MKIGICYSDVNNMGDVLNKNLIEKVFNCKVIRKSHYSADMIAIGSGLKIYLYEKKIIKNIRKKINGLLKPTVYVWGTGFINYAHGDEKFYKKNMIFKAVRGNLTKNRVEKIIGRKLNIPTADGGLLASYFIDKIPQKKYDVGIIAHFREKECKEFQWLLEKFDNSTFIDVQDSPENVTKKIAECKTIISSSLHGLIISDSLNIPNIHIVVSDKLIGDGYKFDDYYSSYNLKHEYIKSSDIPSLTLDKIIKNYKISKNMVDEKKKQLIDCFPFK